MKDYAQLKKKVSDSSGDVYSGKDKYTHQNTPPVYRTHMNSTRMRRSCSANVLPPKTITDYPLVQAVAKLRAEASARSPLRHICNTDYVTNNSLK